MKLNRSFIILLLFVGVAGVQPGHCADGSPALPNIRFALREEQHAPNMTFGGRNISADLYKYVSGGWGHDAQSACVLTLPGASDGQLVSLFLALLQEGLANFRGTLESKAGRERPERCFSADAREREMFFAPDMRVLERVSFELSCMNADIAAELEKSAKTPDDVSVEERERIYKGIDHKKADMWFDSTEFVLHNAAVLWNTTSEEAKRLFFLQTGKDAYSGKLEKMPALLQRSVYLRITPEDYVRFHPELAAGLPPEQADGSGTVGGGWGYSQDEAIRIALGPEGEWNEDENEKLKQDVPGMEDLLFSARSILEQGQPLSSQTRLHPVSHFRDRQERIAANGRMFDAIRYVMSLAPQDLFNEYLKLQNDGDEEGIEKNIKPGLVKKQSEMWFDITRPNGDNNERAAAEDETDGEEEPGTSGESVPPGQSQEEMPAPAAAGPSVDGVPEKSPVGDAE